MKPRDGPPTTCFRQGKPKITQLTPFLSLDRIDGTRYRRNLRLTLRTFVVLEKHNLSDAHLASLSVEELEKVFLKHLPEMPQEIQCRWEKQGGFWSIRSIRILFDMLDRFDRFDIRINAKKNKNAMFWRIKPSVPGFFWIGIRFEKIPGRSA